MSKKIVLALVAALAVAGAASAQVTISGGFALSAAELGGYDSDVGVGGNIYADYLLPVGIPLSLGAEFGVDTSSLKESGLTATVLAVPLLLRVAYHFDLMSKLDLYLVAKIGYVIFDIGGDVSAGESYGGVGFGFDVGAAYYFTSFVGAFAEVGFDRYNGGYKVDGGDSFDGSLNRFLTLGLSVKF
ncbi:MAG: outer membrane beta-barrel protein [Treponema sp.]|jgi:hypothetical protein|nr:outer membrane beta-barrel protein [Treponema sp.]